MEIPDIISTDMRIYIYRLRTELRIGLQLNPVNVTPFAKGPPGCHVPLMTLIFYRYVRIIGCAINRNNLVGKQFGDSYLRLTVNRSYRCDIK